MRLRQTIAALLVLLAVLPAHAQDFRREPPGAAFYIPPINPAPHWYEVRGGSWRVPPDALLELRSLVDKEIGRNKHFFPEGTAARYAIQFRGETVEGRQLVQVVGACNALGESDWRLSQQFIQVRDGGKCYFEADYRPDDKRFRFRYHGYA